MFTNGGPPQQDGAASFTRVLGGPQGALCVIFATVPRMVKSHEVAGLRLDPPAILVIVLRWSCNQAETRIEAFDLERVDLNPAEPDRTKLGDAALKDLLCCTLVQSFSRS